MATALLPANPGVTRRAATTPALIGRRLVAALAIIVLGPPLMHALLELLP